MKKQAKAIIDRLEAIMSEITLFSQEVEKTVNRDKVSLENEARLSLKAKELGKKEMELKEKFEVVKKDREEISRYSNTFSVREKEVIRKEESVRKDGEKMMDLKRELAEREIKLIDSETEREKLEIEKRDFAIIQSKVEKERKISRDRKEMLDERERKISAKEELLRKRLNA